MREAFILHTISIIIFFSSALIQSERRREKKTRRLNQDQESRNPNNFNPKKDNLNGQLESTEQILSHIQFFLFAKLICAHIQMTLDTSSKRTQKSRINEKYICVNEKKAKKRLHILCMLKTAHVE